MDIDAFWEYADPVASEQRFREALETATGDERLELLTQIARTYGLRDRFDEAHQLLDEVEGQLGEAGTLLRLRYLLERGRSYNSSGERERARELFLEAWELGRGGAQEGLAVDAAHMLAITYGGSREAIEWNRRGLEIARGSGDGKAKALIPAMLNNSAWDLFDVGNYAEALPVFEQARDAWLARGKPQQIHIARWSVGRCLRALERHEQALAIQRELEAGDPADGFVFEEIAENLAALRRPGEARPYFGKAVDELSKDAWFVEHEADRLARLRQRSDR